MQPMSSAITGALAQAETQLSSTGLQHSETASGKSLTESAARDRLVAQKPTETDRNLLAWLESSLGVVAKPNISLTYPLTGGYRRTVSSFDVSGITRENRQLAFDAVKSAMTRPTHDQVEEWIAGLAAVTAQRVQSDDVSEIALSLYVGRLRQYPADVVKETCMAFALRREKPNWFPTLSEIDEACEKATKQREQLLKALS